MFPLKLITGAILAAASVLSFAAQPPGDEAPGNAPAVSGVNAQDTTVDEPQASFEGNGQQERASSAEEEQEESAAQDAAKPAPRPHTMVPPVPAAGAVPAVPGATPAIADNQADDETFLLLREAARQDDAAKAYALASRLPNYAIPS